MPPVPKQSIKVGTATKLGIIISILTLLPPVITQIVALVENVSVHWSSAEKTSLIAGAVVGITTIVIRAAQAVAVILQGGSA